VTIPANANATVYVPAKSVESVTEGGAPASRAAGVRFVKMESGAAVFSVGSGTYHFVAR
jgi:alpha-L-rhamnosidase